MSIIYLDNSATTAPSALVAQSMSRAVTECWGNPSSVHSSGIAAKKLLEDARKQILLGFGIRNPSEDMLIFTGSGTEADNLATTGVLHAKKFRFIPRVITTDSEHPAILEPLRRLASEGAEIIRLSTKNGLIDMDELAAALTENTVLVSIMSVNNETGAVYDIKSAFSLAKRKVPGCITHTDAVQAYMKLPVYPEKLGCDLVTVSAHKINGPKGVGALYVNPSLIRKKQLVPVIRGGGQERGFRSGTENIPGIAGFSEAVREKLTAGDPLGKMTSLRAYLLSVLPDSVRVNTPAGRYLPCIVSVTLPDIKSEVMLRYLSSEGICVSSGSACSSHHKTASPVLLSFGLSEHEADCTLRISMSADNTKDELSRFASVLSAGISRLCRIH